MGRESTKPGTENNGEKLRKENTDQAGNRKHPTKAGTENTQPKSVWEGKTPTELGTENAKPKSTYTGREKLCAREGKTPWEGKAPNREHETPNP